MTEKEKNKLAIQKLVDLKELLLDKHDYLTQKLRSYRLTRKETEEYDGIEDCLREVRGDLNTLERFRNNFDLPQHKLKRYNKVWEKYNKNE